MGEITANEPGHLQSIIVKWQITLISSPFTLDFIPPPPKRGVRKQGWKYTIKRLKPHSDNSKTQHHGLHIAIDQELKVTILIFYNDKFYIKTAHKENKWNIIIIFRRCHSLSQYLDDTSFRYKSPWI